MVPNSPITNSNLIVAITISFTNLLFRLTPTERPRFWEYAADTANYIYNRIPHFGIHNKTPFEVIFHSKIDYAYFKTFGCCVFFFVPKQFRNKFENNALPGIFLGYHPYSSSYKILNLSNNKIILCRSVEFFKNHPANSNCSTPIPDIKL